MPVYVDQLFDCPGPRGHNRWCHMTADSLEELHAMAEKIGMKRAWFQNKKTPHYDLIPSKRALAVKAGGVEIDQYEIARQAVRERRRLREQG